CWTSAVLLDLFRGTDRAAAVLIAAGIAGTVPAAATGLADWSALHQDQQRVGLVHAICQAGAATLFLGSLAARAGGRPGYGRALSGAGLFAGTVGSHLGGPLHQGRIVTERGAVCVTCPWHGSTFVISDGTVVHGPATARQPSFETRVTDAGRVELRPRP